MTDNLIQSFNKNRRNKWHKATANLNFTYSSRQAWNLVRKLGPELPKLAHYRPINPNDVVARFMKVTKA